MPGCAGMLWNQIYLDLFRIITNRNANGSVSILVSMLVSVNAE